MFLLRLSQELKPRIETSDPRLCGVRMKLLCLLHGQSAQNSGIHILEGVDLASCGGSGEDAVGAAGEGGAAVEVGHLAVGAGDGCPCPRAQSDGLVDIETFDVAVADDGGLAVDFANVTDCAEIEDVLSVAPSGACQPEAVEGTDIAVIWIGVLVEFGDEFLFIYTSTPGRPISVARAGSGWRQGTG